MSRATPIISTWALLIGLWAGVALCDDACPATCDCVTSPGTINCQRKGFTTIPSLASPTSGEVLDMKYNNIEVLTDNAFQKYPNLVDIELGHNMIHLIQEDAFSELPRLRRISLSNNNISADGLPEGLFEPCPTLTDVEIGRNPYLTELPPGLFLPLSLLKLLDISSIGADHLDESIFSANPFLRTLLLEGTPLEQLPRRIFAKQNNLDELNLNAMNLHYLDSELFLNTVALSRLELDMNPISVFPPGVFATLSNLTVLFLSQTQMHIIPEDLLYGLINLEQLWMNRSPMLHLPPTLLRDNTHLKELQLKDTLLQTLPEDVFMNTSALETLRLDGSPITSLPGNVFKPLPNLKTLSLHKTQLTSLSDDLFQNNTRLESLSLNYSPMKMIPKRELSHLRALKTLSLSQAFLTYLDEDSFEGLEHLQTITLTYNNITTIEANTFNSQLDRGQHVYFTSNPITCDCFMRPFRLWMLTHVDSTLVRDMHIVCQHPDNQAGRLLTSIHAQSLTCANPQSRIPKPFVRVEEGTTFTLSCDIVGDPRPVITWEIPEGIAIKEGESHPSFSTRPIRALNNHTLVVENAAIYMDGGEYACIVDNQNGRHIAYASVELSHKATVISTPKPSPTDRSSRFSGGSLAAAVIITMLLTIAATLATAYAIYRHTRFGGGNIDGDKNKIVTEMS